MLPKFTSARQILYRLLPKKTLPNIGLTKVEITRDTNYIYNTWFKPYSELEIKALKSEYGLQKRTFPQVRYKRSKETLFTITKEIQQHIQYYEQEGAVITTLIFCTPNKTSRLNCQHYFVNEGLQYSFRHSDRNFKDWRRLQAAIVSKVKSWEVIKTDL